MQSLRAIEAIGYNETIISSVIPMPDLTVVYESGILRPTSPIAFPEGQTLQISDRGSL
jgi:hypothetical protein